MKKFAAFILVLGLLCSLSGCAKKYQRISFDSEDLGEVTFVDEQTKVTNLTKDQFPKTLPIYEITPRDISHEDFKKMLQNLGIENQSGKFEMDGNKITGTLVPYTDPVEDFSMTDEELEVLAKETFAKLPFIQGEYEYKGIVGNMTRSSDELGTIVTRVAVRFNRVLDGVRVAGDDRCDLWFNADGFVEIYAKTYDYKKTGTMDLVSYESAAERIKNPDALTVEGLTSEAAQTLCANQVELYFINQNSRGCTILQPIYNFKGTATSAAGKEGEFQSKIIAIPESYTYEKKDEVL
ncbi:MAG: hypothetical protein IJX08_09175 [Clostridia bacterium]|nr:hypothetical protein [Clostridia bacterium]